MLEAIERDGVLVVDSRLIAEELGVLHNSLKDTVSNNASDIEEAFGQLRRETKPSFTSNQNEVVYLLTEDQATYVMTLSRNTEQVKKAKLNLVQAFSKAKQALYNIQQQAQQAAWQTTMAEVMIKLDALSVDKNKLEAYQAKEEAFDKAASEHKGCAGVLVDEMEYGEDDDQVMTTLQFMTDRGIEIRHRRRLSLSASYFQKVGKQVTTVPKVNGQLLLEVRYLRQAARFVLGL
jgi:phage regulator Rha-like protein